MILYYFIVPKWQKVVNSYRLRVLISLSKKEAEADLNIKAKFAEIFNNPTKYPILGLPSDNLSYVYNSVFNKYPTNPDNFGFNATRWNMAETFVKTLTDLKDPHVFQTCEPADSMLRKGFTPSSFKAYLGANSGYYVKKGAISGNFTAYTFNVNTTEYKDQAAVKYKGNNADGLRQILTQKYLGFFQQSGWEAFYNQRRTGVPNFGIGDGNTNGKKIPKRWQYPTSERTNNADNWKAALNAQFGNANDDINAEMWLVK